MKKRAALSILPLIVPGILVAQARGTIVTNRMIVEKAGSPPDTTVTRAYSAGTKTRSEYVAGKHPGSAFGNDSATIEIMTFSDSGMTIYSIDTAAKTYSEFRPGGVMKGVMEMLKGMGSEMKMKFDGDSAAVDSIGEGGVVAGYRTVHFRTRFSAHMAMRVMGDSFMVAMTDTMDSYVAPALKDERDSAAQKQALEDMKRSVGGFMPFDTGGMLAKLTSAGTRIAKTGVLLKMVNTITSTSMGIQSSQRMTTEALKFERAVLPDSLFQVPPGFKKVDTMFKLPKPAHDSARSLQSPRTPS